MHTYTDREYQLRFNFHIPTFRRLSDEILFHSHNMNYEQSLKILCIFITYRACFPSHYEGPE